MCARALRRAQGTSLTAAGHVSPHKAACEGRIRQFELHTWPCAEERLDVEANDERRAQPGG
jgi:hypothetical protein